MTRSDSYQAPTVGQGMHEEAAMPYIGDEASRAGGAAIEAVRARNEHALMAIDGVQGVGIGHGPLGDEAIVVYLRDASVGQHIPTQVEGYPVVTVVTGPIDAYRVPGSP